MNVAAARNLTEELKNLNQQAQLSKEEMLVSIKSMFGLYSQFGCVSDSCEIGYVKKVFETQKRISESLGSKACGTGKPDSHYDEMLYATT